MNCPYRDCDHVVYRSYYAYIKEIENLDPHIGQDVRQAYLPSKIARETPFSKKKLRGPRCR